MRHAAVAIALAAAFALGTFAVVRGTWAVGGSDSSCYGLMADAFARGALQPTFPLAHDAPWADAGRTFAPAGFIASPVRPDAASPICTPGFSLLLAPFRFFGGADGIFLFTPIAAALMVWFSFVASRGIAGDSAGAFAAVVVATTPIVLFQSVQPMNDVTTAALWAAVLAAATADRARRWWLVGALTGLALLVRPNLAPAAVVVGLWVLIESRSMRATLMFTLGAAPSVAVTMLLHWALYGSPFRVGYGSAADLFALSNVSTNAAQYAGATVETMTPFPLLAVAAPFVVRKEHGAVAWLALGIAAATVTLYLFYQPFPEWWYLRFLLPALVCLVVLSSAVATLLLRRGVLVAALALALALFGIRVAMDRQAPDLQRLESRFRHSALTVRDRLPANAMFVTVWQSGTVRYHAGREAILWDSLDPASLDRVIAWAAEQGYEPFLLLERWEEPRFRERFSGRAAVGSLDWPPRLEIDRQVRVYAPADRAAYLTGRAVPTEHVIAR